ncbi:hypothetical protein CF647_16760 [Burkholderia sp. 117]|nr:hypothetical protein CF649_16725 [Burkholderia sp. 136(2017)]PNX12359.1 hypothetical protein CF650_26445 [Burkholderia sp. 129]PNX28797.1 hypothetical protein CF647_16760 [Burkholderia sp. 117]PNX38008.1 hypothetical protein CF648_16730 [Burkholderia sp. 137]
MHGGARGLLPCGEKEIGRPPSGACGGPAAWNFCGVGKYLRTPRAARRAAGARQAAARDEAGRIGAEASATRPGCDPTATQPRTGCEPAANKLRPACEPVAILPRRGPKLAHPFVKSAGRRIGAAACL